MRGLWSGEMSGPGKNDVSGKVLFTTATAAKPTDVSFRGDAIESIEATSGEQTLCRHIRDSVLRRHCTQLLLDNVFGSNAKPRTGRTTLTARDTWRGSERVLSSFKRIGGLYSPSQSSPGYL